MDKEILRKQIFDEAQDQFETKLREAKRQKSQVEAELEAASERWRAERRRLNSEIDRLETDLAEAKESNKKSASKAGHGIDPAEISKIKAAAEEKLNKAAQEWETERGDLRKEISRLERTLTELLERSNNPLRATMPHNEPLQARLEEATRNKEQIEQEFRRARAAWEDEKQTLSAAPVKSQRDFEKARNEWESERQKLTAEISAFRGGTAGLNRGIDERTASRHETSNPGIAEQLREALQQRHFLEQELAAANETIRSLRAAVAEERTQLEKQISILEADLERERTKTVDGEVVEQLRRQYDDRLREIAEQKTQLAEQLQHASATLESERSRFVAAAAPSSSGNDGADTHAVNSEITRVESMIADINRMIDDPSSELSTVIRKNVERAELDAYLKGILFSVGRRKGL